MSFNQEVIDNLNTAYISELNNKLNECTYEFNYIRFLYSKFAPMYLKEINGNMTLVNLKYLYDRLILNRHNSIEYSKYLNMFYKECKLSPYEIRQLKLDFINNKTVV